MIIKNNMTPNDVQKQVASMSKFKRGFNQNPNNMNDNFNKIAAKNNPSNISNIDLNKKMQAMRNVQKLGK